jgi:hypothetical protein
MRSSLLPCGSDVQGTACRLHEWGSYREEATSSCATNWVERHQARVRWVAAGSGLRVDLSQGSRDDALADVHNDGESNQRGENVHNIMQP